MADNVTTETHLAPGRKDVVLQPYIHHPTRKCAAVVEGAILDVFPRSFTSPQNTGETESSTPGMSRTSLGLAYQKDRKAFEMNKDCRVN